jgi:EAL domain-containing protein (putative c-di-GMP-specific phosphodiesterase class I)
VGEGIETGAQSDLLRVLGCDVIQGFGVAEPMDEEALIAWIADNQPRAVARRMTSA